MLLSVVFSIIIILKQLDIPFIKMVKEVTQSDTSRMFFTDWKDSRFFLKQFLSGVFICIAMTGLDQEMMQKNLSCRTLRDAQKNMITFSFVLIFVNLMFLFLGSVLYYYADVRQITHPGTSDNLYPYIAFRHLGAVPALIFVVGLISAAYPSADGALTSLTTAFSIDFIGISKRTDWSEKKKQRLRYLIHVGFAAILLTIIIIYNSINNSAIIEKLFAIAGYTYGPLLGLFAFGLFTKWDVKDKWVPLVAIISPVICYWISSNSKVWFNGYRFGFELLLLNGLLTFIGLFLIRKLTKS
jgi:Na+/proline symporter